MEEAISIPEELRQLPRAVLEVGALVGFTSMGGMACNPSEVRLPDVPCSAMCLSASASSAECSRKR